MASPMQYQVYLQRTLKENGGDHFVIGTTPDFRDATDMLYLRCEICHQWKTQNVRSWEELDTYIPFAIEFSKKHAHRNPPPATETKLPSRSEGRRFRED